METGKVLRPGVMVFLIKQQLRGCVTTINAPRNSRCFEKGPHYCEMPTIHVTVPSLQTVLVGITSEDIVLAADELYKVGDMVVSKLGGGFKGYVTGFEYETNLVICKSAKTENRCRYAYTLEEIEPYVEEYYFYQNKKYLINGKFTIRVIESPCPVDKFLLVHIKDGSIYLHLKQANISWKVLHNLGIEQIESI